MPSLANPAKIASIRNLSLDFRVRGAGLYAFSISLALEIALFWLARSSFLMKLIIFFLLGLLCIETVDGQVL